MISRKRESIPGHMPSLATPVVPLPFTFSLIGIIVPLSRLASVRRSFKQNLHLGYRNFSNRKTVGTIKTAMARICSQFIADFLQLGQRILQSANILPQ